MASRSREEGRGGFGYRLEGSLKKIHRDSWQVVFRVGDALVWAYNQRGSSRNILKKGPRKIEKNKLVGTYVSFPALIELADTHYSLKLSAI